MKQGTSFSVNACSAHTAFLFPRFVWRNVSACLKEQGVLEAGDLESIWGVWERVREAEAAATSAWNTSPRVVSKLSDTELRVTSSKCPCGLVELCWVAGGSPGTCACSAKLLSLCWTLRRCLRFSVMCAHTLCVCCNLLPGERLFLLFPFSLA